VRVQAIAALRARRSPSNSNGPAPRKNPETSSEGQQTREASGLLFSQRHPDSLIVTAHWRQIFLRWLGFFSSKIKNVFLRLAWQFRQLFFCGATLQRAHEIGRRLSGLSGVGAGHAARAHEVASALRFVGHYGDFLDAKANRLSELIRFHIKSVLRGRRPLSCDGIFAGFANAVGRIEDPPGKPAALLI